MIMRCFYCLFLPLILLFVASCSEESEKQQGLAHLRIVTMISNADTSVSFQPTGESNGDMSYTPGQKGYEIFEPGYYQLTVWANGAVVYKRRYVLGKNAYYTLAITGLAPSKPQERPNSWNYTVKHIFSGAEARVKNDFLPISFMLYDSFHSSGKDALIRITNAAPNAPTITVKSNGETITDLLSYPKTSDLIYAKPKLKTLKFYYGDIKLAAKTIQAKGGYLYNVFISNGTMNDNNLKIHVLETKLID